MLFVRGSLVQVIGLSSVQAGERVLFESGVSGIALNLEKDLVGVALFGNDSQVSADKRKCESAQLVKLST